MSRLVTLVILDGYGINKKLEGNAVAAARKPNLDKYIMGFPNTVLRTSGRDVGLLDGQMGNSEVGHTNIGAGRVVYQNSLRITESIEEGEFFQKKEFLDVIDHCKSTNSTLHLLGLLSDGGVHSLNSHLYALLELARSRGLQQAYIHCILDGRDVPPASAEKYLEELENKISEIGIGKIATIMGRYFAMDRDTMWDRVEKAYNALVLGEGKSASSPREAIKEAYAKQEYDEFVTPTVILEGDRPVTTVSQGDGVIFFNFRGDRAREITKAFVLPEFNNFKRKNGYLPLKFVSMTEYDAELDNLTVAYKPIPLTNVFGEFISKQGLKQLRIAETTKYAHVTFFFNGGVETPYEGEDRVLVPSPKVDTFDQRPEMSAHEVTDRVVERINSREYDVIVLNYANGDMVGHSANFEPTKQAIETVDQCVGEVVSAVQEQGGVVIITADHGNAEQLIDYATGGPMTAHTTNVVPFILIGEGDVTLSEGRLADIAPTILDILGVEKPVDMTGDSLIQR